jgi:hypothetical protein
MILEARQGPTGPWLPVSQDGCIAMAWAIAEKDTRNRIRVRRYNARYERYEETLIYYAPPMLRMIPWSEISDEVYRESERSEHDTT